MINLSSIARAGHGVISGVEKTGIAGKVASKSGKVAKGTAKVAGKGALAVGGFGLKTAANTAASLPGMLLGSKNGMNFMLKGTAFMAILSMLANPKISDGLVKSVNNLNKVDIGNKASSQNMNTKQLSDLPAGSDSASKQNTVNDSREQVAKVAEQNTPQQSQQKQSQDQSEMQL